MSLRTKCAILLIAFELTLAVTLLMTVRHIRTYFDDAAKTVSASSRSSAGIRRLRLLLRDELHVLRMRGAKADVELGPISEEIDAASRDLSAQLNRMQRPESDLSLYHQFSTLEALLQNRLSLNSRRDVDEPPSQTDGITAFSAEKYVALDRFLGSWETTMFEQMTAAAEGSFSTFYWSVLILSINMIVGAILGVVGLLLVRRWVLLPVQELTQAADEIGRGNLDYRANVRTHDELGRLAGAINEMSADVSRLGRQAVFRERAAAMGELISYIAHNIRNPLAGIRSLSDSCQRCVPAQSELAQQHKDIVASVERLQRWLREVEHVCRPLDVRPGPVSATAIIGDIVAVFRPMADRRSIEIQTNVDKVGDDTISVDAPHFEQALAAVVGNAIEACGTGGRVTIGIETGEAGRTRDIVVGDSGPGISEAIRDSVFQPSVSSKSKGTGLGLSMARRVTALHGGELTFMCPKEGGTIFRFTLPILETLERGNG